MRQHWLLPPACCALLTGCWAAVQRNVLTLATTTSTQDTGLLDALLPTFKKQTGMEVKVIAVGTGQALALARRGDADVVLVHSRKTEDQFVAGGFGVHRRDVMYNDFVLVGPAHDPTRVSDERRAAVAFAKIAQAHATFISRGDESGTHQKEQELWQAAQVKPAGDWYLSAGSGMGETLRLADEKNAYTLSDRGTFLAQRKSLRLTILLQGDPALFNPYAVIAVNPKKFSHINYDGAMRSIHFLPSPPAQRVIADFGRKKFGQPLFFIYKGEKGNEETVRCSTDAPLN